MWENSKHPQIRLLLRIELVLLMIELGKGKSSHSIETLRSTSILKDNHFSINIYYYNIYYNYCRKTGFEIKFKVLSESLLNARKSSTSKGKSIQSLETLGITPPRAYSFQSEHSLL